MLSYCKKAIEFDKVLELIAKYTKTEAGKKLLLDISLCKNISEIEYRFKLTNEIKFLINLNEKFEFNNLLDLRNIINRLKIEDYIIDAQTLYKIGQSLYVITKIREQAYKQRENCKILWEFLHKIPSFKDIYIKIFNSIEYDGTIKDSASEKLSSIRREILLVTNKIQSKLKEIISKLKQHVENTYDYITIREGRFVIPVLSSHYDRVKGIVHDYSQSKTTVFVEPFLIVDDNNELRQLKEEEKIEIDRIIKEINEFIRPSIYEIINSFTTVFQLDMYNAIALFAIDKNCNEVKVVYDGKLEIVNGRHPLLSGDIIPLNLKLPDNKKVLILSGPNAGGKTVVLKTIGLFCLMVRCGILISASNVSVIPFIDKLFVDIGDLQSIESNLSTFSAHIKFLSTMISQIKNSKNTLVLLDELGSGSAPNYSSAIACAIIWHLSNLNVLSVITTHFSEVVNYAYSLPNAINGSLEFNSRSLKPTYRLILGVPGASYAIQIAKNYGLQHFIIKKAQEFLNNDELKYEKLICEIVKFSEELKKSIDEYKDKLIKLEQHEKELIKKETIYNKTKNEIELELKLEYEKKYNELLKKVNSLSFKIKSEKNNELNNIELKNEKIDIIDEINKTKKEILKDDKDLGESVENLTNENNKNDYLNYLIGDTVTIKKLNLNGVIKEIDERKKQVKIQFNNNMEMWIKFSMIDKANKEEVEEEYGKISYVPSFEDIKLELDIRGLTCDDGINEVEKYLIKAYEHNLNEVRIIHGKGTLALKTAIENYLRTSKLVESFRSGNYGEGDFGVTFVKLKT